MQLDRVMAEIRPRSPYEAADLGVALARQHYFALVACWCLSFVPIAAVTIAILHAHPLWAGFVIWWLKPLFEHAPIHYLSRSLFSTPPRWGELIRAQPGLLLRGLRWITWERVNLSRCLIMPVRLLEGADAKRSRQRSKLLAQHGGGAATATTIWFHLFEEIVTVALLVLLMSLLPESWFPIDWEVYVDDLIEGNGMSTTATWFIVSLYLMATTLLTPFYVGAGFGLYLNARTILEGWDIELAFRRMTQRLSAARLGAAALLIFASLCLMPAPASAQDEIEPLEPAAAIRDVLADPDFHERTHTIKRYRFIWESSSTGSMSWGITSNVTLFLLLVLVCAAVAWIVVMLMRHLPNSKRRKTVPESRIAQAEISILDRIDAASLPDDILSAARAAFAQGRRIEALSFLYRGAIRSLVHDHDVRIMAGDTESDCLRRLGGQAEPLKPYLATLVRAWIAGRYAHQEPAPEEFEMLCRSWPFTSTGSAA